ncbi:MAG: hypothetical protein ABIN80_26435 [Dyadobacter sp.]
MHQEEKVTALLIWMFLKNGVRQSVAKKFDVHAFLVIALIAMSVKVIFHY